MESSSLLQKVAFSTFEKDMSSEVDTGDAFDSVALDVTGGKSATCEVDF